MTQADWECTSRSEELTGGKLGIRNDRRSALASNSDRVSTPLTLNHRFCTEQQLEFVGVVRDFDGVENSRRRKRLKNT